MLEGNYNKQLISICTLPLVLIAGRFGVQHCSPPLHFFFLLLSPLSLSSLYIHRRVRE
jgi:hypothetical protein